jgi:hypothetical protein
MPKRKPTPIQRSDSDIQHRTFYYVDAMPGAGKTEYFVTRAVHLLSEKKPDSALIYVAPTILLLKEALKRIASHPGFKPAMAKRVTLIATPSSVRSEDLKMKCHVYQEAPRKVINYILGLSETCGSLNELPPVVQVGDLVLTTHESFVQVNHKDPTGRDFGALRNCEVIFDEARHCVIEHRVMKDMSNEHLIRMRDTFTLHPAAFRSTQHRDANTPASDWYVYKLTNAPTPQKMKTLFGVTHWTSIPLSIRKLHRDVSLFSDSGRASVFVMANVNTMDLMVSNTRNSRVSTYTMLRPTSLFNYYKRVILTSAFFKDSHMYHFLKEDGHEFKDLRNSRSPGLASIYSRDRILRDALSKRLVVGVLMNDTGDFYSAKEYRNNLTSSLLRNGMVIPSKLANKNLMDTIPRSFRTLQDVVTTLQEGKSVSRDAEIQVLLRQHAVPPLWILIRETCRLVELAWEMKIINRPTSLDDVHNLALLVLNVSRSFWSQRSVPYLAVVHTLYTAGSLTRGRRAFDDDDDIHTMYSKDERQMIETTPAKWVDELAKHLYVDSPQSKFVIPPSNRLHGINKYSRLNAFVHLAALNPTPQLIAFYKIILGPDYDIDQDHSIENLVQMLYRTSLRSVDAKSKVLMIVPYQAQAQLLQTKIGCDDLTYMNTPRLSPWNFRRAPSAEKRAEVAHVAGVRSAAKRRLNLNDAERVRLNSLRGSVARFRKLLINDPKNPKVKEWKAKIADYETQIQTLVQK